MNKEIKVNELKHQYDKEFTPSQEYLNSMPDLQNSGFKGIPIDFVGVHNIRSPTIHPTNNPVMLPTMIQKHRFDHL